MERVTHPSAFGKPTAGQVLRSQNALGIGLRHDIVSDEVSFMELNKDAFSEDLSECFEIQYWKSVPYAVLPVPVSQKSVQVRVEV